MRQEPPLGALAPHVLVLVVLNFVALILDEAVEEFVLRPVVVHHDALVLAVAEKHSMLQMRQDNKTLQDNMQVPQVQEEERCRLYSNKE